MVRPYELMRDLQLFWLVFGAEAIAADVGFVLLDSGEIGFDALRSLLQFLVKTGQVCIGNIVDRLLQLVALARARHNTIALCCEDTFVAK